MLSNLIDWFYSLIEKKQFKRETRKGKFSTTLVLESVVDPKYNYEVYRMVATDKIGKCTMYEVYNRSKYRSYRMALKEFNKLIKAYA